mmetsp:Transcript_113265/g.206367  ORF Transcript_113265/g.206367 Transcript_113265/m.206367 type:complete len:100 (-) Transcript_113265:63-362(-)
MCRIQASSLEFTANRGDTLVVRPPLYCRLRYIAFTCITEQFYRRPHDNIHPNLNCIERLCHIAFASTLIANDDRAIRDRPGSCIDGKKRLAHSKKDANT